MTLTLMAGSGLALADHGARWGDSCTEGPEHWGELDPHFKICRSGKNQTPIDLTNMVDSQLPPINFHYRPGGSDDVNNGHTIQINDETGSSITFDGHDYELKQYHFHAPSENHIDGKEFPMDAHLVHADRDGNPPRRLSLCRLANDPALYRRGHQSRVQGQLLSDPRPG